MSRAGKGRARLNLLAIYSMIFLNNMGMLMSPSMDTLVNAFPSEPYSKVLLISTLPALVALPFIMLAGNLAGIRVRYRTLALIAVPVLIASGTLPFFLRSLDAILVCRAVYGVCYGLICPLSNALILRSYEGTERVRYLGYGNIVIGLGGVVFQMTAGWLCMVGWNYLFLGHLLGTIPLLLIAFGLIEPKRELPAEKKDTAERCPFLRAITAKGVLPLFLLVCVLYICTQTKSMTISSIVKTEGMGDATTSAAILSMATFGALLGGVLLPAFCRCVKKYRIPILVLILSLMTVTNLLGSALLIGLGYCVGTMAFMMNLNLMTLRASRLFPPEEASRAVSLIQCADKMGTFLATYFTAFCSCLVQALKIDYSIYRAPIVGVLIVYLIASVTDAMRNGPETDN